MFHPLRLLKRIVYVVFLAAIVFAAINYKALVRQAEYYFYQKYPKAEVVRIILEDTPRKDEGISQETRLLIPKINVEVPVISISDNNEETIQKGLEQGVVHYPGTAGPGEGGNYFILGHSSDYLWRPGEYKDVFALLNKLKQGDLVKVEDQSKEYIYEVTEKVIVSPEQVDVLRATPDATLSLMTCWPIGTPLKRLIVKAKLIRG